jgi:hypothetical protein
MIKLKTKLAGSIAGAAIVSVLGMATAAYAANDFTGNWTTTGGNFANAGATVKVWGSAANGGGSYSWRDGHLMGRLDGPNFEGVWSQSASGQRCREARGGSNYWGRFDIHLTGNGHFEGHWSYCDAAAGSGGGWSGRRV